jgi:hypothetical protein
VSIAIELTAQEIAALKQFTKLDPHFDRVPDLKRYRPSK